MAAPAPAKGPKLYHPQLRTTFHGVIHPHGSPDVAVDQYRGVRYASLKARWTLPRVQEAFEMVTDAMKFGPACPQFPFPSVVENMCMGIPDHELKLIQRDQVTTASELDCLNLNITVPRAAIHSPTSPLGQTDTATGAGAGTARLPVLFWMHGGGHDWGNNGSWCADGGALVARSIVICKPIVVVSANYRLGPFGNIASNRFKNLYSDEQEGDGVTGNWMTHDIAAAIEWTYRYIEGFGGDPANITIGGESAGGSNVVNLLWSKLPAKWNKAIVHSYSTSTAYPRDMREKEDILDRMMQHAGVSSARELALKSPAELLATYAQTECTTSKGFNCIDHEVFDDSWRSTLQFAPWSNREILLGDNRDEGNLWFLIASFGGANDTDPTTVSSCLDYLTNILDSETVAELSDVCGLSSSLSIADFARNMIHYLGYSGFNAPIDELETLARKTGNTTIYRYAFDKPTPFQGAPVENMAGHTVELLYLFGIPELFSSFSSQRRETETRLLHGIQDRWIQFLHGNHAGTGTGSNMNQPWPSLNQGKFLSVNEHGLISVADAKTDFGLKRDVRLLEFINSRPFDERLTLQHACTVVVRGCLKVLAGQQLFVEK